MLRRNRVSDDQKRCDCVETDRIKREKGGLVISVCGFARDSSKSEISNRNSDPFLRWLWLWSLNCYHTHNKKNIVKLKSASHE
jgi:hypothetical protein